MNDQVAANVISFSSNSVPVLAVLRKNLFNNQPTTIYFEGSLPENFDEAVIKNVYGYQFETQVVDSIAAVPASDATNIYYTEQADVCAVELNDHIDFCVSYHSELGSILIANGAKNASYVSDIQHVRRRETIAMTPSNCEQALIALVNQTTTKTASIDQADKSSVMKSIEQITGSSAKAVVGSSGLSIQYAIGMGLVHAAMEQHPGKPIKFVVPPNCYGGTNDQARRVAACIPNVEVVDMRVDGGQNM
ncbi:unnamed protein product, partial [Chrysoparadoxa australica]